MKIKLYKVSNLKYTIIFQALILSGSQFLAPVNRQFLRFIHINNNNNNNYYYFHQLLHRGFLGVY